MTNYIEVYLHISDNQKEKIQNAMKNKTHVTIRISEEGNDKIALTQTQINKLKRSFEEGKGADIKLSKTQFNYNKNKVDGGFLAALARMAFPFATKAASKVLPALGVGALSGLASTGVSKIFGDGVYMKKGGCLCKIERDGLYLSPQQNELEKYGDRLYLKKGKSIYDGSGIIHDIAKDIPLLN